MTGVDALTRSIQRRQLLLFGVIAGTLAVALVLWLSDGGSDGPSPLSGVEAELASGAEAEAGWVRQSESRIGTIESRLREIEARNRALEQDNARLQAQLAEEAQNARDVIDRQAAVIENLTRTLESPAAGGSAATAPTLPADVFSPAGVAPATSPTAAVQVEAAAPAPAPLTREFELQDPVPPGTAGATGALKSLSNYVPAGSYAEAVVLAGADASAGVASQGDPRPVLLRLTGPAYGATVDGTASRTDIGGCTVTGAAYGDLSSEKVYVRLQTMACGGDAPGTVIETAVSGFVAGAGAAGVRGPVVSREGALVQRAFLSGVFSGIGQGVNQALGPRTVLAGAGAATIGNTDLDDIGRAGLGAGAGTAGQEVSDYLIRRAEQYQPVIQLAAATPVTVVFLEGAWLDGRHTNEPETEQ